MNWGNCDYKQLQRLRDSLATLQSMDMDRFCTEVSKELAARLLALVIPRTPVGQYPKSSGKKGGTLRRGWTSKTQADAASRGSSNDAKAYKIASRVEDNQTLFDIIQNALDETLKATGQMYVLYDNVGKLTLKSLGNMKLNMLVDEDTAGDYDYKSSIATQTYDKIKLSYENKETGKREIYIAQDGSHINQWGVLQYYEKLDSKANAKAMADALLDLYNTKTRTLKLQDVLGDIRVRAGTLLVVMLGLGDINVSNYLMAEQVKHTFNDGQHLMELKMRGGTFVA